MSLNIKQPIPAQSIKSAIRFFYKNKKINEISDFIDKVKTDLPSSEQAFTLMLASYVGHYDSPAAALKVLQDSESRFANSIEYIKTIAVTYTQLNDPTQALHYYEKAFDLAKNIIRINGKSI